MFKPKNQPKSKPEPASPKPERWIAAAVEGDVEAFGELYQLHADQIYRYFFYRVHEDHEAQDLTAQVFLNAWKAIGRYEIKEVPFLVWLYAIARNLLITHNKRQHNFTSVSVLGEGVAEQVADHSDSTNPVSLLLKQAENEELVRAFEQLNDEQQQVIYYRFVENWDHSEVARVMHKSEGAIRAIQFRALQSLRRIMGNATGEVNLGKNNR